MEKYRHRIQAVAWLLCWCFAFDLMDALGLSWVSMYLIFIPGWFPMLCRIMDMAEVADREAQCNTQ